MLSCVFLLSSLSVLLCEFLSHFSSSECADCVPSCIGERALVLLLCRSISSTAALAKGVDVRLFYDSLSFKYLASLPETPNLVQKSHAIGPRLDCDSVQKPRSDNLMHIKFGCTDSDRFLESYQYIRMPLCIRMEIIQYVKTAVV